MKVYQVLLSLFVLCSIYTTFGIDVGSQPNKQLRLPPFNPASVPAYARFGSAVAFVGRFNTSGFINISSSEIFAFGASNYTTAGAVYLFNYDLSASTNGPVTSTINPYDSVAIGSAALSGRTLTIASGDQFGASLTAINDADGDGFPELAVGAPGTNNGQGAVYIMFLGPPVISSSEPSLRNVPSVKYVKRIPGTVSGSLFGASLTSRIVANSSNSDLLIGAPGLVVGGVTAGGFYYVTGIRSNSSSSTVPLTIGSTTLLSQSALIGTSTAGGFGSSVVNIGDVNRDGTSDFAFGLPTATRPGSTVASGVIYISIMNSSHTGFIRTTSYAPSTGLASTAGSLFGASLSSAGDFDKNGIPDVVVGAPGSGTVAGDGGVYLITLNATGGVLDTGAITANYFTDFNSVANQGSSVYYRENDDDLRYTYLLITGGSRKSNGAFALQGEVLLTNVALPSPTPTATSTVSPSLTPSRSVSNTPSVTPSVSASLTPSVSQSVTPSVSTSLTPSVSQSATPSVSTSASFSPSPSPVQFVPFLWNEKCFRQNDGINCGVGIGPGYYPPTNNFV